MKSHRFVGRRGQLGLLERHLTWVLEGGADQRGRCLLLRGRRRVGKSRLVEEFLAGLPRDIDQFWFTCTKGELPEHERVSFVDELAASGLPHADAVGDTAPATWAAALRRLADAMDPDRPAVVVVDELPWMLEQDGAAEGALQTVWDRVLSKRPVLLIGMSLDLLVQWLFGWCVGFWCLV